MLQKWRYPENDDVTMEHLLRCPLLEQVCDAKDLAELNDTAEDCVQVD